MKKESITSIAKRLGVSPSTVSRVLNNQASEHRIKKETAKQILDEAKRCNYTPNVLAQGLRTNKTKTIGMLVPGLDNPFFAHLTTTVMNEARVNGYTVIIADSSEDPSIEEACISSFLSRKIDGILIAPCSDSPSYIENVTQKGIPIVLLDRYYFDSPLPYIATDNYAGAYDATQLLISNGHTRIACIQGSPHHTTVQERLRGFCTAISDAGLHSPTVVGRDFSTQNGYIETKLLLEDSEPPSAIFAMSNTIAVGVLQAAKELGVKIPDDLSLVCFDNNIWLDFINPTITCVAQPVAEIGMKGVQRLIHLIKEDNHETSESLLISPQIILRNSIKPIK